MPRKPLIRSSELPYHVYSRANYREWFRAPLPLVWEVICEELFAVSFRHGARFHAFLLMSNHYHGNVSTPESPIDIVMRDFQRSVSKKLNRISGVDGHLFGNPYGRSLLHSEADYARIIKYIYRNPIRAGICQRVQDYPYSTLDGLLGNSRLAFPLWHPFSGDPFYLDGTDDPYEQLEWLNLPFRCEEEDAIRKAIRRRNLTLPREFRGSDLIFPSGARASGSSVGGHQNF